MSWNVPEGLVAKEAARHGAGHLSTEPADSRAWVLWGLAEERLEGAREA